MARLPPRGSAFGWLYEGEPFGPSPVIYNEGKPFGPTIDELLVELKLLPMQTKEVGKIRAKLKSVVGSWSQEINRLEVQVVVETLIATAQHLEGAKGVLQAAEDGLQQAQNIEVVHRITELLSLHPEIGNVSDAEEYLRSACRMAETISHTCRVAACELGFIQGKRGRTHYQWYDEFTKVLCGIARKNGIKASVENDRKTHQPKGRFVEVAEGFERLFPREMRSPSRAALAKRLSGSLRRFRTTPPREEPAAPSIDSDEFWAMMGSFRGR